MNELFIEQVKQYFKEDYLDYLDLLNKPYYQGFFLNTNKADKETIFNLIDFKYENNNYSNDSFYHHEDNIGKTKVYDLGLIYPQEIAASLTTNYINKDDIEYVVDMCASPGGKTINILNRLNKDVLCISNDISHSRVLTLSSNLERLGLDNVIITNKKSDVLAKELYNFADIVILDAPCSSEGIIRKYPEVLQTYSLENIDNLSLIQSSLLENAYSILKNNGQLIYSTCTYSFKEDELQIIDFLNRHPDMKIIPINIDSHSTLKGCVKLSPLNNTEGQFFCIMKKNNNDVSSYKPKYLKPIKDKLVDNFINDNLLIDDYYLYHYNDNYYLSLVPLFDLGKNVIKYGINIGKIINNRFEPNHNLYRSNSLIGKYRYSYDLNDDEYNKYIQGYEIKTNLSNNYYLITYKGLSLGYGKCSNNIMKNKYPKGLRRMI